MATITKPRNRYTVVPTKGLSEEQEWSRRDPRVYCVMFVTPTGRFSPKNVDAVPNGWKFESWHGSRDSVQSLTDCVAKIRKLNKRLLGKRPKRWAMVVQDDWRARYHAACEAAAIKDDSRGEPELSVHFNEFSMYDGSMGLLHVDVRLPIEKVPASAAAPSPEFLRDQIIFQLRQALDKFTGMPVKGPHRNGSSN